MVWQPQTLVPSGLLCAVWLGGRARRMLWYSLGWVFMRSRVSSCVGGGDLRNSSLSAWQARFVLALFLEELASLKFKSNDPFSF